MNVRLPYSVQLFGNKYNLDNNALLRIIKHKTSFKSPKVASLIRL